MNYTLENVRAAFEKLGGLSIPMVHIAGSKGKGTVATLLAKIIELHGERVGLFTSPFIEDECEMVAVNGVNISSEDFERLKEKIVEIGPLLSVFEVQTLAAYEYFKEQNCELLVVECGLGGLHDATNVATQKALSILTHVELEHQEQLGDTLGEITRQKLGICRKGVPLMTGVQQVPEVFAEIEHSGYEVQIAPAFELGNHHPESVGLAASAADFLGYSMDSVIEEKLAHLLLPGRFEVAKRGSQVVILDGAHTYDSVQFVLEQVQDFTRREKLPEPHFGIHFLKDKNPDLWRLFPRQRSHWIELHDERAGLQPPDLSSASIPELLKEVPFVVFVGSFRLMKAVRQVL
ncbi:hypothetical protein IPG41_06810 [Candidatus Peregrinibacteria bacterium]|nr:MAG: hypothetical protein IPG41_06810 [Candidatus Peregrinibacteria bacterium]